MKLKEISSALSHVKLFKDPSYELEQYPTSSELASSMIFAAHNHYDDVEDRDVADFGKKVIKNTKMFPSFTSSLRLLSYLTRYMNRCGYMYVKSCSCCDGCQICYGV